MAAARNTRRGSLSSGQGKSLQITFLALVEKSQGCRWERPDHGRGYWSRVKQVPSRDTQEKNLSQESNAPAPCHCLETSPSSLSISTILLKEGNLETLTPGVRSWMWNNRTTQVKRKHEAKNGHDFLPIAAPRKRWTQALLHCAGSRRTHQ